MKIVGKSSLWEERYRPQCMEDVILPEKLKAFFTEMIEEKEIQNMLFYSTAGRGKTTIAKIIGAETDCDVLYINAALNNSIETIRHDVQQFAMTHSLMGGKKLVILDEVERLPSEHAQEALKVLIEEASENARFIFCTNNVQKMIDPLMSRLRPIEFNFNEADSQKVMFQIFKRVQFILDTEEVEYNKEVLAKFIQTLFPDIRKCINRLQVFSKLNGNKINEGVFGYMESAETLSEIIALIKKKKYMEVRELVTRIDPTSFYRYFYNEAREHIVLKTIPNADLILAQYAHWNTCTSDTEINLMGCINELMSQCEWK